MSTKERAPWASFLEHHSLAKMNTTSLLVATRLATVCEVHGVEN